MDKSPPVRIKESDTPLPKAELNEFLTQDGYFTNALYFQGPKAREFGRQLGILK